MRPTSAAVVLRAWPCCGAHKLLLPHAMRNPAAPQVGGAQQQVTSKLSPCDVKALQKCLQENKGDRAKVGSPVRIVSVADAASRRCCMLLPLLSAVVCVCVCVCVCCCCPCCRCCCSVRRSWRRFSKHAARCQWRGNTRECPAHTHGCSGGLRGGATDAGIRACLCNCAVTACAAPCH
jgi:hypothetical protein